jgi:hypothetical protein
MSVASLAALLTASASFLAALATFLHSAQTRRIVRQHKANPYVHAGRLARSQVAAPAPQANSDRWPLPESDQPR